MSVFPPDDEPTDTELDAAVAAADAELLAHARAHADPTKVLNALLSDTFDDAAADRPAADASSPRLGKAADRILARVFARYLATEIDAADRVARRAGNNSRATARNLARNLTTILEHADAPVFVRVLDRDHDQDRVVELVAVLELAHTHSLSRFRPQYLDLHIALQQAGTLANHLVRDLMALPVDASGADLTGVPVTDPAVLDGVVWDDDTRWPPGLREQIVDRSEEIASGVYQVRGGTERDPSAAPKR